MYKKWLNKQTSFDISASVVRYYTLSVSAGFVICVFLVFSVRSLSLSLSLTMQSAMALPFSQMSFTRPNHVLGSSSSVFSTPRSLRFCGLRREAFGFSPSNQLALCSNRIRSQSSGFQVSASASSNGNGAPPKSFDYDLIIIGAGVGGHGAALHAVEKV